MEGFEHSDEYNFEFEGRMTSEYYSHLKITRGQQYAYDGYLDSDDWQGKRFLVLEKQKYCCKNPKCKKWLGDDNDSFYCHHTTYKFLKQEMDNPEWIGKHLYVLCKKCNDRRHEKLAKAKDRKKIATQKFKNSTKMEAPNQGDKKPNLKEKIMSKKHYRATAMMDIFDEQSRSKFRKKLSLFITDLGYMQDITAEHTKNVNELGKEAWDLQKNWGPYPRIEQKKAKGLFESIRKIMRRKKGEFYRKYWKYELTDNEWEKLKARLGHTKKKHTKKSNDEDNMFPPTGMVNGTDSPPETAVNDEVLPGYSDIKNELHDLDQKKQVLLQKLAEKTEKELLDKYGVSMKDLLDKV